MKNLCQIAKEIGADFAKTSTGFSLDGATVNDVTLMRETDAKHMGIKAPGEIHTLEEAEQMIAAGASRIDTSAYGNV